jgi:3'-5' exoribonuclease
MDIVNRLWRELLDEDDLRKEWGDLEPASERVRLHLLHLIASHHGELAFGSPVVPKTPEAQALHYIDNLDAKMEMYDRGYEVAPELGKNVYERVRPLPGRLIAPLQVFEQGNNASSEE